MRTRTWSWWRRSPRAALHRLERRPLLSEAAAPRASRPTAPGFAPFALDVEIARAEFSHGRPVAQPRGPRSTGSPWPALPSSWRWSRSRCRSLGGA